MTAINLGPPNSVTEMLDFSVIAITPLQQPDVELFASLARTDALATLDTGTDPAIARAALAELVERNPKRFAVLPRTDLSRSVLPEAAIIILPGPDYPVENWQGRMVLAQVTSLDEAADAVAAGASGLIAKGSESGGRVGEDGAFVLFQRLIREFDLPIWVQGGIGVNTASACVAGGAQGVVLDSQLALTRESTLPEHVKRTIAQMDGSETAIFGGHRIFSRPGLGGSVPDDPVAVADRLGVTDRDQHLLPCGQDAAFAAPLAQRFVTAGRIVGAVMKSMAESIRLAQSEKPLAPGNPFSVTHDVTYPVLQGPMTRVSDTAEFAEAVSQAGGLPFIALSLLNGSAARRLLEATKSRLSGRTWGVGILGFVDADLRAEQMEVIESVRPPVAIIAGGRPSQARSLEALGITTYLHVPSPGLLKLFLADGARRFVFEGRECGGHVGPRTSFALWQSQLDELMLFPRPEELHLVFAGGIHDTRSAAMVSAMLAPLASKGAKVAILMGTAYLFTREAVSTGAIVPAYQRAALSCVHTVLLETAPGHATRCVDSPFVQAFANERRRLEGEGMDSKMVWAHLERLNLGRLRIASKGLKREGDSLMEVGDSEQYEQGMYMIGAVATMHDSLMTARELHRTVTEDIVSYLEDLPSRVGSQDAASPADIAIVGMAGVFPGADDVDVFWSNVVNGVSAISEVDPARWNPKLYYDPESRNGDKTPSKWGGFLGDISFNPLDYGIPPQSLSSVDPAQLLSLEVARRALDDAGYYNCEFDRSRTSVIFGAEAGADISVAYGFRAIYPQLAGELPPELDEHLPRLTEDSFPGVLSNVIAGRIANRLDLGGVNFSVDAACASSLAALDLGVKELLQKSSDMVLCGGADLHNGINDYLLFAGVHALSRKGLCRTFDSAADGTVLGEAVACVVLKRLADAERDGDRIYAVIRAVAGSSDGRSLGLTAPRKEGQMRALQRAYARAGTNPRDVGLVEAHGTGTVVGDRTELGTLTETFGSAGVAPRACGLGSVKSQIGHTKCAAGLASIIKAAKALHHRVLPPTLNIEKPNPGYDPLTSPFDLSSRARPWVGRGHNAGVSAFGFGGANFHAVLSAYDGARKPVAAFAHWPCELVLLRGQTRESAQIRARAMLGLLDSGASVSLRDAAATLTLDEDSQVQFGFVADSMPQLRERLKQVLADEATGAGGPVFTAMSRPGKVAFLFPGQGSQRLNMFRDLFVALPGLHRYLELGAPWLDHLFPPEAWTDEQRAMQEATLTDTRNAQPALGMVGLAVADILQRAGVEPDMVGGHSYGELVALCVAGSCTPSALMALSQERADAIVDAAGSEPGEMAAVSADSAAIQAALSGVDGIVEANLNSPTQTVISGTAQAIERALDRLKSAGISAKRLPVAAAFHSPLVANAAKRLQTYLENVDIDPSQIEVWSNGMAAPYPKDPDAIRKYVARHVAEPVRFMEQIEHMYDQGARIFIEAGPGQVLSGLVRKILGERDFVSIAFDRHRDSSVRGMLTALAELAVTGIGIRTEFLFAGRNARRLDLDDPAAFKLPPTLWKVNGWLAWPVAGELPRNRLRPTPEPVYFPKAEVSEVVTDGDMTVLAYLENLRDLAAAQRDVMMGYLGAEGAPAMRQPRDSGLVSVARERATPVVVEKPAPDETRTADSAAAAGEKKRQPLADMLLGIVSEKTGYPRDMLGLDQDLEAELSIDSIKRVEILGALAEKIDLDRSADADRDYVIEQLAAQKTLREIVDWLGQHQSVAASVTEADPENAAEVEAIDLEQELLRLVSEKTGYPQDMLDLNLDLEADLSIDSIKRVEILGALAGQLSFALDGEGQDRDYVIEQLAARKTLGEIINWLRREQASPAAPKEMGSGMEPQGRRGEQVLCRFVPAVMETPTLTWEAASFSGRHFAVSHADHPVARSLCSMLEKSGAMVSDGSGSAPGPGGCDTLICFEALQQSDRHDVVKDLFEEARNAVNRGVLRVFAVTGFGGRFAAVNGFEPPFGGAGISGLLKSIAKDRPDIHTGVIDVDPHEDPHAVAEAILAGVCQINPQSELGYSAGKWFKKEIVSAELPSTDTMDLPLSKDSVVLVTGGARGITAAAAIELARRTHCHLILVGRSRQPDVHAPLYDAVGPGLPALRQALIREGKFKDPASIEAECRRILANREIKSTLDSVRSCGARVEYHSVDVRNEVEFGALVDDIYRRFGRVDGVIHGAGIIEDKLLGEKDRESFDRVFDTKVAAARVLAEKLREDTKFVVFFSSVSGVFGNRGQSDYAAAGDFLDRLAMFMKGRIKGRVVSIDWGPWGGAGMVSDDLASLYEKRGIGLIPLADGVRELLREIGQQGQQDAQVVLMVAEPTAFQSESMRQ